MKPVDQTIFGGYVEGQTHPVGNCFQACIASLLNMDLDQVPHFVDQMVRLKLGRDTAQLNKWLDKYLLCYVEVYARHNPIELDVPDDVYYLASGPGPRGHRHAVIYRAGALAHDPHPSREGLLSVDQVGFIAFRPRLVQS